MNLTAETVAGVEAKQLIMHAALCDHSGFLRSDESSEKPFLSRRMVKTSRGATVGNGFPPRSHSEVKTVKDKGDTRWGSCEHLLECLSID
jgi:hypothetical protein